MNNKGMIPNEEECLVILKEYKTLPNILDHSQQVKKVSQALVDNLIDDRDINKGLVTAAALLHDIAKTICLEKHEFSHDFLGGKILRDMGYVDVAKIVEAHILMPDFNPSGRLEEREIVHYADKRVMHDRIVSIDERIDDIIKRYSKTRMDESFIRKNKEIISGMEKKIQSHLKINIDTALKDL